MIPKWEQIITQLIRRGPTQPAFHHVELSLIPYIHRREPCGAQVDEYMNK